MKIVIAGAGKVGFELARSLSAEHEVTVIDKNAEALERLGELIDIYPLTGDIQNPMTYRALLDSEVDIFIAVTDSDEANILSTLLANDTIRVARRIIRLRNSYFEQSRFLAGLGDMERVFPFRLAAETVRMLLAYPGANNVKHFPDTDLKLISIKVDNPLHEEQPVAHFENERLKIVGIEREKDFVLPDPERLIRHGDLIYFLGDSTVLESLHGQLDLHMPPRIGTAVVFGADTLGIEVARVLIEEGVSVKIVEKDIQRCHRASDVFQEKVLVINSRYDEAILYEEEQLSKADMVIATDSRDETNIVQALQAIEHRIPKVVAINNERKFYSLMHQLGMVVARGPRTSAYYAVLESIASDGIIQTRHFCGGEGVVLARWIFPGSALVGRPIKSCRCGGMVLVEHRGLLFAAVERSELEEGDRIYLILKAEEEEKGEKWIRSL